MYTLCQTRYLYLFIRKTPKFQRLNGWDLPFENESLGKHISAVPSDTCIRRTCHTFFHDVLKFHKYLFQTLSLGQVFKLHYTQKKVGMS